MVERMSAPRQVAYDEIMDRGFELAYERHKLQRAYIRPTGILLPKRLRVFYDGEDADPNFSGSLFGLPITWAEGEEWGIIVHLPKPKE